MHPSRDDDRLRIAETFYSIQGEGGLVGMPSYFVRTTGCSLRCEFCDTPYTSWEPVGAWRTIAEIVAAMPAAARHVVVTGGEPMLWPNLPRLTAALRAGGRHLTIETAGVVYQSLECDLMSISPKLGNSDPDPKHGAALRAEHRARRIDVDVLTRLMGSYTFQLKLVIARPEDLGEVDELLERLPPVAPSAVVLMPLGVTSGELADRSRWLAEICKARGYRFTPRLHVDLFGNTRGT